MAAGNKLMTAILTNIVNPAIIVLFAIALLVFVWGVLQYVRNADDADARAEGSRHMLYGVIGLAIMISAFAIVRFVVNTFSLETKYIDRVQK